MPSSTADSRTREHTDPTASVSDVDTATDQHPTPALAPTATTATDTGVRTAAENKLWTALLASPLSTAEELATAAGIGRSTAKKILARWAGDAAVNRIAGMTDGARHTPDRWSITEPDHDPVTSLVPTPTLTDPPPNSDTTADTDIPQADLPADTITGETDSPIPEQDSAETAPQAADIEAEAPDAEEETASDTQIDPEPFDPGDEPELGPDPVPADADADAGTVSADSVGVIELGNGIMLIYPTAIVSSPLSCADSSACGMVDLLQLLAAVFVNPKPVRRAGTKRPREPREPGMNHSGAPRLAKGALRGMVEDFLSERPGEEFSPNEIAIALGRSSGAVANALDQMESDEVVTMTNEKPRRYTLAASE